MVTHSILEVLWVLQEATLGRGVPGGSWERVAAVGVRPHAGHRQPGQVVLVAWAAGGGGGGGGEGGDGGGGGGGGLVGDAGAGGERRLRQLSPSTGGGQRCHDDGTAFDHAGALS